MASLFAEGPGAREDELEQAAGAVVVVDVEALPPEPPAAAAPSSVRGLAGRRAPARGAPAGGGAGRAAPRVQELPPVPSIRMLREPLRSAAEMLGKRFDLGHNARVGVAGSCGDVFVMPRKNRGVDANRIMAVKQQLVQDPSSLQDQAFREARILLQLNHLALERKCPNFTFLQEWFKSRPPLLFGAAPRGGDPAASVYMYFVLDFAERNLFQQRLEVEQFRSVLFQLLYALSVAQREFQFVHHDLHLKNILLQELPEGVSTLVYHDAGTVWYISGGPLVKIADFGLARLRVRSGEAAEEVIYNVRDSFSELFSRDKDLLKLLDELRKVRPHNAPPEVADAMKRIRALIRSSATLREMLRIPFFDVFTRPPERPLAAEECVFSSSDGDVGPAQRAATGAGPLAEEEAIPEALLFEQDKVELAGGEGRVATRQTRKEQVEYSVFSAGRGAKRGAAEESPLSAMLREEAEEEEYQEDVRRFVAEKRRKEAEEARLQQWFKDTRVISEPLASAASRVKLGQTLDEARADPAKASFREAARLAREAEAAAKARRRRRSRDNDELADETPPHPPPPQPQPPSPPSLENASPLVLMPFAAAKHETGLL